jgi:hypothetical protein
MKGCIKEGARVLFNVAIVHIFGSCILSEIKSRQAEKVERALQQLEHQPVERGD